MSANEQHVEVTMTFGATSNLEIQDGAVDVLADLVRFQVGVSDLEDIDVDISAVTITSVIQYGTTLDSATDVSREQRAERLHRAADETDDAQDHDELHAAGDAVRHGYDQTSNYLHRWVAQLEERWTTHYGHEQTEDLSDYAEEYLAQDHEGAR